MLKLSNWICLIFQSSVWNVSSVSALCSGTAAVIS